MAFDSEVGGTDSTSYLDVADSDELAELRVGGSAWADLTDDQKERALATATRAIDTLEAVPGFLGDRADGDQRLAWPRSGTDWEDDELPRDLTEATFELAFSYIPILTGASTADPLSADPSNGNIKRERVGPIDTEFFAPTAASATGIDRFPAIVQGWLELLVVSINADAWGSASASRGS